LKERKKERFIGDTPARFGAHVPYNKKGDNKE
jgi:hypothetical protein